MKLKTHCAAKCGVLLLVCWSAGMLHAKEPAAPFEPVMDILMDAKSLRLTGAHFDHLLSPHCEKTFQNKNEYGVTAEYKCDPVTHVAQIRIDTREGEQTPDNFVKYIVVSLTGASFAPLKASLLERLGKPAKRGKNSLQWPFLTEKVLSRYGKPMLTLSREEDGTTGFRLAFEQGS